MRACQGVEGVWQRSEGGVAEEWRGCGRGVEGSGRGVKGVWQRSGGGVAEEWRGCGRGVEGVW